MLTTKLLVYLRPAIAVVNGTILPMYIVILLGERVFFPPFCVLLLMMPELFRGFLVKSKFLQDEAQFRVQMAGHFAVIQVFFGGFQVSPYATSLELKNIYFGLMILGYELAGFLFALSCIKVHFTGCMF